MNPADALRMAREQGLDLVEVAPQVSPPVCRILDFNKFKYEEARREREGRKKHHVSKLKEVKFKPRIAEHDYQVKLAMLKRFLMRGDKAKVTMVYRGRELAHTELGARILERLVTDLKSVGKVERNPLLEGRFMTMVFGSDREGIRRLTKQTSSKSAAAGNKVSKSERPVPASAESKTEPKAASKPVRGTSAAQGGA